MVSLRRPRPAASSTAARAVVSTTGRRQVAAFRQRSGRRFLWYTSIVRV